MTKSAIGFVLAACLLAPGCSKPPPSEKALPAKLESLNAKEEAPPPPADPTAPVSAEPADSAPVPPDAEAMLSTLNSMVSDFSMSRNRMPASLDELVAAKVLRAVPEGPPGKKFAIDPKLRRVVLVNR